MPSFIRLRRGASIEPYLTLTRMVGTLGVSAIFYVRECYGLRE